MTKKTAESNQYNLNNSSGPAGFCWLLPTENGSLGSDTSALNADAFFTWLGQQY